jgi:DNA-binding MarR family transcriptional regulator
MKFILDGTAGIVLHPTRYQIIQCLSNNDEPLFVDQIAKEVNIHPRMVSHHLDVLEKMELVESKYELVTVNDSKRRIAARFSKLLPKTFEVLKDIKESVS